MWGSGKPRPWPNLYDAYVSIIIFVYISTLIRAQWVTIAVYWWFGSVGGLGFFWAEHEPHHPSGQSRPQPSVGACGERPRPLHRFCPYWLMGVRG